MKILITGANGQLGRALNLLIDAKYNPDVGESWQESFHEPRQEDSGGLRQESSYERVNTDIWNREKGYPETFVRDDIQYLDITDYQMVEDMISKEKPDIVINCAAHTAVDRCETEKELAFKINAEGPKNLAMAVSLHGGALVQVSTDYVFAGNGTRPYIEEDAADPKSVYGASKWEGEQMVRKHLNKHFIIRTAWLYGDGNNFVRTMLRLSEKMDEIRVVNDQKGTPTYTMELAKMILNLIRTENYGTYHGTCEGETNWYEFAVKIFELAGIEQKVVPVSTEEYGSQTNRPAYSVLENKNYNQLGFGKLKNWEDALAEYMQNYQH